MVYHYFVIQKVDFEGIDDLENLKGLVIIHFSNAKVRREEEREREEEQQGKSMN
ncbi:MAG: hypothetical protein WBA07_26000 [Rivularia sp. (in: cyanobacteria)]